MSLATSANRIVVTEDTSGNVVFDTNERMFISEFMTGSITLGTRIGNPGGGTSTWSYVDDSGVTHTGSGILDQSFNHTLASINAHYDTVFGAFNISSTGWGGTLNTGWWQGSGTYLDGFFISNGTGNAQSGGAPDTPFNFISGYVLYDFVASGGSLILQERVVIKPLAGVPYTVTATTVSYKVYVGSFN